MTEGSNRGRSWREGEGWRVAMGGEGEGERQSLCRKSQDKGGQVPVLLVLLALLLLNNIVCAADDQGGQVAVGKCYHY